MNVYKNLIFLNYRLNDQDTYNLFYLEKADTIVKKYFKDFKDFSTTWTLKVTWENMTLFADRSQVPEHVNWSSNKA